MPGGIHRPRVRVVGHSCVSDLPIRTSRSTSVGNVGGHERIDLIEITERKAGDRGRMNRNFPKQTVGVGMFERLSSLFGSKRTWERPYELVAAALQAWERDDEQDAEDYSSKVSRPIESTSQTVSTSLWADTLRSFWPEGA